MTDVNYNVVVLVDSNLWKLQTEENVLTDWVTPLSTHPQIKEVVLAGAVGRFADFRKLPKITLLRGADERQAILQVGAQPGVEGVVRLRHQGNLRFPISHCLLNDAI